MHRCPHCDWDLRDADRFCSNCGRPLIKAHIQPAQIQTYVGDQTVYQARLTVTNVGTNPLRIRFRPSSDLLGLEPVTHTLAPGKTDAYSLTVDLAQVSGVREFIEIDSNESHQALTRIPVQVSRPPDLRLQVEPDLQFYGESTDCRLAVIHAGGGAATIKGGYVQDAFATLSVPAEETLVGGDRADFPLLIDHRDLQEGENQVRVVLDLAGLGEQAYAVPFRLTRRPNLHATPIRLGDLLPGRVRQGETEIRNDSDQTVTIHHIRTVGGDWLRPQGDERLPIRLEPGWSRRVKVEVSTHGLAGQMLNGQLAVQWNRDQTLTVPVRVRVLSPHEYEGYAGVDFGTTNSCVCVSLPEDLTGRPVMVPLHITSEGDPVHIIPTAIYYPNPDDLETYVVGEVAKEKAMQPDTTAYAVLRIKRRLGSAEPIAIYERQLKPEQVAAHILRYLLDRAEDYIKQIIRRAVVTVPADYSTRQMRAMLEACKLAGLAEAEVHRQDLQEALEQDLLDVLDEPLGAALDYIYTPKGNDLRDHRFLIYDLGGGTLDVSLVHIQRGDGEPLDLKVLAVEGREIGGEDFTARLADQLVAQVRADRGWSDVDLPYEMAADEFEFLHSSQQQQVRFNRAKVQETAEQVKVALTEEEATPKDLRLMVGYPPRIIGVPIRVTREEFEELIRTDIESSVELVREALECAGVSPGDVSRMILTGGASQMPIIRRALGSLGIPLEQAEDSKECVARGAFRMGWQRLGVSHGTLRPLGLHNKTSSRYGVIVNRPGADAEFVEVIPKGVDLPTPWYDYPDPSLPPEAAPTASRPVFELPVVRNRSRLQASGALQPIGRIRAQVPGASPAHPVRVRVQMQLDKFKVLRVRVLAGDQQLENRFTDV